MNHRLYLGIATCLTAVCSTSCSQQAEGTFPVSGKVLFEGKPAAGAVVTFITEGKTEAGKERINPSAVAADDGSFQLSYGDKGLGAPVGKYVVLVVWRHEDPTSLQSGTSTLGNLSLKKKIQLQEERRDRKLTPDRLKLRYSDINKHLLWAEVKAENNTLPPFELVDGPAPARASGKTDAQVHRQ
jgi:hypothetical protein